MGYNISVITIDKSFLTKISYKCPGQRWMSRVAEWEKGPYFYSHITDYIRFCVLYIEGGLYSDFDAILLKKWQFPPALRGVIVGLDRAMSDGHCDWCLDGKDIYIAPGVMFAESKSLLLYNSMIVAFENDLTYDPSVFNSVGPKAITEAYKRSSRDVLLLDSVILYPYSYTNVTEVFMETSEAELIRLQKSLTSYSLSLHLFGHVTNRIEPQKNSLAEHLFNKQKIFDENCGCSHPSFYELKNNFMFFDDLRLKACDKLNRIVHISCKEGNFLLVNSISMEGSVAEINLKLSNLIYKGSETESQDILVVVVDGKDKIEIPIYYTSKMVTVASKTMDRIDKVLQMVESVRKFYPLIQIIVSDDGMHVSQSEGQKKGFYYLPLPYDTGLSEGRNIMALKVKTPYILFIDDDFVFTEESDVGTLLHAMKYFDIAAGKSPADKAKYNVEFSGLIKYDNSTLYLEHSEGTFLYSDSSCSMVDFVPNLFVIKTALAQSFPWDKQLKVGEHEDYFYRAKLAGIKVATCPGVSFLHNQIPYWKDKGNYAEMRGRVWDFIKIALKKNNFTRLITFNTVQVDLTEIPMLKDVSFELMPFSVIFNIKCSSHCSRIKVKHGDFDKIFSFDSTEGSIEIHGLKPSHKYSIEIYTGNSRDFISTPHTLQFHTKHL